MRSTTFLQSCCHMHTVSFRLRLFSLVWSTRHKLCCYPILKMCWRDMIPRAKFPWNSWPSSSSLCLWIMQVVTAFATLQFCCHDKGDGGESRRPMHLDDFCGHITTPFVTHLPLCEGLKMILWKCEFCQ